MDFKLNVKVMWLLLILMAWCLNSGNWASAQPIVERDLSDDVICQSIPDSKILVERLTDCNFLRQQDQRRIKTIENLEKENDLLKRESEFKDRIIAIKDMELSGKDKAINDLKDIADRAIKLAEVSKPSSNWQLMGLAGLAVFIAGVLIGR